MQHVIKKLLWQKVLLDHLLTKCKNKLQKVYFITIYIRQNIKNLLKVGTFCSIIDIGDVIMLKRQHIYQQKRALSFNWLFAWLLLWVALSVGKDNYKPFLKERKNLKCEPLFVSALCQNQGEFSMGQTKCISERFRTRTYKVYIIFRFR
jgi:hypothetical protein